MKIAFPHSPGKGGPGSFQTRLEAELEKRHWLISYGSQTGLKPDLVMVVGGTRRLVWLRRLKRQGIPIVQRLDGLSWMHRQAYPGIRKWMLDECRNLLTKYTHAYLADWVIYQSDFVRKWWQQASWRTPSHSEVLYNGVDLDRFSANVNLGRDKPRHLICLEGTLDYSPYAVELLNYLANRVLELNLKIKLYGTFSSESSRSMLSNHIEHCGDLPRSQVPGVLQDAILLSLDVLPACPNTVAEALSSGVPVIGFNTGAMQELVVQKAGELADYEGNPWKLEKPNFANIWEALLRVWSSYPEYCSSARRHAELNYDVRVMTERYVAVFESAVGSR